VNWAAAWALLAAALLLLPGPGAREPDPRPRPPRRPSIRMLQAVAGGASAIGCVLLLGPVRGAATALVFAPGAALAVTRLASRTGRSPPDASLALALDLAAAMLRAGQPITAALGAAAPVTSTAAPGLLRAAGLLRLGAPAADAWAESAADPVLAPVARLACRSADSGIRLAAGFEQLAADVRAQLRSAARSRAHRAGIWAIAPLGLCFLPAFVCLGIVPVMIGIAGIALP
jgi:hypothetical protein